MCFVCLFMVRVSTSLLVLFSKLITGVLEVCRCHGDAGLGVCMSIVCIDDHIHVCSYWDAIWSCEMIKATDRTDMMETSSPPHFVFHLLTYLSFALLSPHPLRPLQRDGRRRENLKVGYEEMEKWAEEGVRAEERELSPFSPKLTNHNRYAIPDRWVSHIHIHTGLRRVRGSETADGRRWDYRRGENETRARGKEMWSCRMKECSLNELWWKMEGLVMMDVANIF